MERLSSQVHKVIDELDETADSRAAFRSKSNRQYMFSSDREIPTNYLLEIQQILTSDQK